MKITPPPTAKAAYWIDVAVDLFFMGDLLVQVRDG
jgi:hypothetical protein